MSIRFVTGNKHKVREAQAALDTSVEQFAYDYPEVQAADLESIVRYGGRAAFDAIEGTEPIIVEDSGLFIDGLDGFPGPYSSFVEDTLGIEAVWHLARRRGARAAAFESAVGYVTADTVRTFTGRVEGRIVVPRGDGGFGYDPIFAVDEQTLAERSTAEKNALSHRGRALDALAAFLA